MQWGFGEEACPLGDLDTGGDLPLGFSGGGDLPLDLLGLWSSAEREWSLPETDLDLRLLRVLSWDCVDDSSSEASESSGVATERVLDLVRERRRERDLARTRSS